MTRRIYPRVAVTRVPRAIFTSAFIFQSAFSIFNSCRSGPACQVPLISPAAAGVSVDFITYPNGLRKKFSFEERPLSVYEGETDLKVRLTATKTAKPGEHNLSAKLRVQACDDQVCYAPGTMDLTLPVTVK